MSSCIALTLKRVHRITNISTSVVQNNVCYRAGISLVKHSPQNVDFLPFLVTSEKNENYNNSVFYVENWCNHSESDFLLKIFQRYLFNIDIF